MSWSVQAVGKPESVIRKLRDTAETMSPGGQSRDEYDTVLPYLCGLVEQAVGDGVLVNLRASGHATVKVVDGVPQRVAGSISVSLEQLYGFVE